MKRSFEMLQLQSSNRSVLATTVSPFFPLKSSPRNKKEEKEKIDGRSQGRRSSILPTPSNR